jgi:hypothetical protein
LTLTSATTATRVLFVCTENSARSQLAAAIWSDRSGSRAPPRAVHDRGTFGRETIERFLHTSYDEFAERAIVRTRGLLSPWPNLGEGTNLRIIVMQGRTPGKAPTPAGPG